MAKFCRRSLLLAEGRGTRSCERNNERREGEEEVRNRSRQWEAGEKTESRADETTSDGSVGGVDLAALSARLSQQLEELSRMSSSPSPSPSSSPLPPISPTRPARRSCGRVDTPTTSPLSTPPMRQRRRVSDSSVVMRVEPGRACRGRGASLAGITSKGTRSPPLWVGSPVYTGGVLGGDQQQQQSKDAKQSSQQQNNNKQQQQQRQRKPSIFLHTQDRLAAVEESVKEMNSMLNGADDTAILTALISQATSRQSSVEPVPAKSLPQPESQTQRSFSSSGRPGAETEYWSMGREGPVLEHVYSEVGQPENDYSEPLDSLGRLYTSPPGGETQRRSEVEELRWKLRRERFSEGSLGSFRQKENTSEADVRGKRKLSLGQFVRKLSRGSLMGEGRGDVVRGGGGGERLSKLVNRLVGAGRLASQQVDSSSWEFLSAADSSTNSTPTSTHRSDSTPVHKISTTSSSPIKRESKRNSLLIEEEGKARQGGNLNRKLGGSRDSVYESEYDSSTGSSLTSQDSALSPSTQSSRGQLGQNRALPQLLQ